VTLGNLYWRYWRVGLGSVDGHEINDEAHMLPGKHTIRARATRGAAPLLLPYELPLWHCEGSIETELTAGRYELEFNYNTDTPRFRIRSQPGGALVVEVAGSCHGPSLLNLNKSCIGGPLAFAPLG